MSVDWPAQSSELWPIEKITPYARNSRTHSDDQVAQIAASIREWGWTNPILTDGAKGLIAGEPLGGESARVKVLADLLRRAGFDTTVSADVRRDIWYKLWGNMTMNPISAITGATVDRVLDDPLLRGFCSAAMAEAAAVGARIGCAIDQTSEDRHQITRKLGAFKTSMLQDVEAGRAVELDALVTVVREIAQRVGLPTPFIDALLGLARLHGRVRGLYPEASTTR